MADDKTILREISVATIIGMKINGITFTLEQLYEPNFLLKQVKNLISGDKADAVELLKRKSSFTTDEIDILNNGNNLAIAIHNKFPSIKDSELISWEGNDTGKDDPVDIKIGELKFSLKEDSHILENMGLYKLLNLFTGSTYKKRHIFKDYSPEEYSNWFDTTWCELLKYLKNNQNKWEFNKGDKKSKISLDIITETINFELIQKTNLPMSCSLSMVCSLSEFEEKTNSKLREHVFSKFIKNELKFNENYNNAKKDCAIKASEAVALELSENLDYSASIPRFLRIHEFEYYYAKTTKGGVEMYKVPALVNFQNEIEIESIESSVPETQANILTVIKNKKTGEKLTFRNECRFSHGQFNGTPESKMYYENGGSLLVIYQKI